MFAKILIMKIKSTPPQISTELKPYMVSEENWKMWIMYNKGVQAKELATIFLKKYNEVKKIIASVVEMLKNNDQLQPEQEDFNSDVHAFEFRRKIRMKFITAKKIALFNNTNEILIMSEI